MGNSSRNLTVWQAAEGAGLHYRVIYQQYDHNYNTSTYNTRAVRRYLSTHNLKWWNDMTISERHEAMRQGMVANNWDVARTKYMVMLHSAAQEKSCPSGVTGPCYIWGRADIGGRYGFTARYAASPYSALRFGCATGGDVYQGHEATHLVGADHVGDTHDLMAKNWAGSRTFGSSPRLEWDHGHEKYHDTVAVNDYVIAGGQSGSVSRCS